MGPRQALTGGIGPLMGKLTQRALQCIATSWQRATRPHSRLLRAMAPFAAAGKLAPSGVAVVAGLQLPPRQGQTFSNSQGKEAGICLCWFLEAGLTIHRSRVVREDYRVARKDSSKGRRSPYTSHRADSIFTHQPTLHGCCGIRAHWAQSCSIPTARNKPYARCLLADRSTKLGSRGRSTIMSGQHLRRQFGNWVCCCRCFGGYTHWRPWVAGGRWEAASCLMRSGGCQVTSPRRRFCFESDT